VLDKDREDQLDRSVRNEGVLQRYKDERNILKKEKEGRLSGWSHLE
jgi:hypothetical protein